MAGPVEGKSESSDERGSGSFGSLFKTNLNISAVARQHELPENLAREYMSIDEFCSTNSSEDKQTSSSSGFLNVRLHSRSTHHHASSHKKVKYTERSHRNRHIGPNTTNKSLSGSHTDTYSDESEQHRHRRLNREVIAEMDRQYDHNICLDRFIHEMENQQGQNDEQQERANKIDNQCNDNNKTQIQEQSEQSCKNFDIQDQTMNEGNEKQLPSTSSCESIAKADSGSSSSGSSSVAPRSNDETDSGSRKSSSIKSSTPENPSDNSLENVNAKETKSSKQSGSCKMFKPIQELKTENKVTDKHGEESVESGIDLSGESTAPTVLRTDNANSTNSDTINKKYRGGKPGRKRKRGYIYDPKPVKEKPPKKKIPEASKDEDYWEKRKRNNEAARKSREMRRKKELEVNDRLDNLKKENDALRVAIALLIKRNETLEYILTDYEIAEGLKSSVNTSMSTSGVPVTT